MRMCLVLLSCFTFSLSASSFAQQERVSLKMKEVTVKMLLDEIQRQTNLHFIFNTEQTNSLGKVSVEVKDETVETVLVCLFEGTDLTYSFKGNIIVVKRRADEIQGQQQQSMLRVAGKVTDEKKQVLPGVTVRLEGTTVGTATNSMGVFTLMLPVREGFLEFSFVGFKNKRVRFTETSDSLNVVLEEDLKEIGEVVVTGYQQIDKRHLTSAVNTVKMDDIDVPGSNRIDMMLEGRIPGLTFMQNTGQVGAAPKLRIRGTSTILGSQEPVWVVDGIIQQDPVNVDPAQLNDLDFVNLLGNAISGLNPNDIERIDVLKDASATALYGARAANGVIVITTKMGKIGAPTVSYSMSGTFTQRPRYTDRGFYMMNSKERVDVSRELMEMGVRYNGVYDGISDWIGYEKAYLDYFMDSSISYDEFKRQSQWYETMNTDWLKILTKDVFSHNHSLSISGGSQDVRYYASIGYADEQGNVKGEENKRYSSALKLTATYDKFSAQFGINGSVTNKKYNPDELNVMSYAHSMNRAIPLYGEDGEYWRYKKDGSMYSQFNIVDEMKNSSRYIDQYSVSITGQLQYKFTEDFKLIGTGSYQFNYTNEEEWFGEDSNHTALLRANQSKYASTCPFGGTLKTITTKNNSYTLRLQADYSKYLGMERQHFTNVMLGYELSSTEYNGVAEEVRGYYKDRGKTFPTYTINQPADFEAYYAYHRWNANNNPVYTDQLTNLMSGFLTLTYGYDDRYILNFNARADWSNAFGSRSNEKLFPVWSISGRWNISNDVLKDIDWIENLALRLSYGLQGNMMNNQPTRLIIKKGDYNETLGGFASTIGAYPNPNLKWEKTHSYNVGLDFSFLHGKINGSFAFFYKKTKDAFLSKKVASQNGITNYVVNAGDVENKGVELALYFTAIDNALSGKGGKRGFVWRIDPQIGQTLNKLVNTAINKNNKTLQDEITVKDLLDGNAYIAGTPLNTFYSYRFNGLDKMGIPTFKGLEDELKDELIEKYNEMALSDKKDVWMEVLGESGTRVPTLQGGLNNYIAYRNFSLSFNLAYSIGNKIRMFKLCSGDYSAVNPKPHNNLRKEFVNRWRGPGDEKNTNIPGIRTSLTAQGNSADVALDYGWWRGYSAWTPITSTNASKYELYDYSDLRVVRGDYLRLQSLSFRYVFDKELIQKVGMTSAYISLSATNLFTICDKKLKGQNPEQSGTSSMVNISVRPTYSVSLNVNF